MLARSEQFLTEHNSIAIQSIRKLFEIRCTTCNNHLKKQAQRAGRIIEMKINQLTKIPKG
jgi:hypothetical protein